MTFLQKYSTNQLEKNIHILGPLEDRAHVCKSIFEKLATPPIFASSLFLHLDLLLSLQLPKWAICILVSTILLFFKNGIA